MPTARLCLNPSLFNIWRMPIGIWETSRQGWTVFANQPLSFLPMPPNSESLPVTLCKWQSFAEYSATIRWRFLYAKQALNLAEQGDNQ